MNYNRFISDEGWLSFNYPSNMISVEEEKGTYLFYTEQTGSFRVTPIKLEGNNNFDGLKYLKDLAEENNAEIIDGRHHKYVFYISNSQDDDGPLTIYNWIFTSNNKIVYCSYTIDSDSIDNSEIKDEKKEVFKIIDNLTIQ